MGALQDLFNSLITLGLIGLAGIIALGLTGVVLYLVVLYLRLKKRMEHALEMVTVEVRIPKDNEIKIDSAEQMFSAFQSIKHHGWFSFLEVEDVIAFEIVGRNAEIRFYISAPNRIIDLVEKTIYAHYQTADIQKVEEPNIFSEQGKISYGGLVQKDYAYMPLKTYRDLPTDSISAITRSEERRVGKECRL